MTCGSPALNHGQGFASLSSLLRQVEPEKLDQVRQRLGSLGREELIVRFRDAFASAKRLAAHLMSVELTWRGVPPCFRHETLGWGDISVNQRFDLLLADLVWLRHRYYDHAKVIRYRRCKLLIVGGEPQFHREAEYAFWEGRRPAWKLVGSLSLTEQQQWDCAWLRSTPIKKRAAMIEAKSIRIRELLRADLESVRRTTAFGDVEAAATLRRRHGLWLCSQMVDNASPTLVAARFEQLTGDVISRQLVAKQLGKMKAMLTKKEVTC